MKMTQGRVGFIYVIIKVTVGDDDDATTIKIFFPAHTAVGIVLVI